jgi:hypothetical protein
MDGPQFKVDDVIAKYIELRDKKDQINAAAKTEVKAIEANMDVIEAWLMNEFNTRGGDSIACDIGTAFIKEVDFANVSDWNLTLPFIQTHGLWQMLKKDVNKTAVKEFIDANGVPPPGVNWGSKREIQVRRKS